MSVPLVAIFHIEKSFLNAAYESKRHFVLGGGGRFAISQPSFASLTSVLETPRFLTLPLVAVFRHGETIVSPTPFKVRFRPPPQNDKTTQRVVFELSFCGGIWMILEPA